MRELLVFSLNSIAMVPTVSTLVDIYIYRKEKQEGITFIKGRLSEEVLSYEMVFGKATHMLAALQANGMEKGDELVLQIADLQRFVTCFWAGILGGMIPVPLAIGRNQDQQKKLLNVWQCLHNPWLITDTIDFTNIESATTTDENIILGDINRHTCLVKDLELINATPRLHMPAPDDLAYIQFSSGSTSQPKGVRLTHKNILTNCKAILAGIKAPETGDRFFSWMPLTHDMGLIGYHLTPVLAGWHHYLMPTELFIRKPVLWLHKLSEHRITFTASPNFGYKYVLDHSGVSDMTNIDLSSLRIITNGAEPISAALCHRFQQEMAGFGLRENVIFPVYGLAEASLAVTFSEPGAAIKTVQLDRNNLRTGHPVIRAEEGITFVNVGSPLTGNCRLRLVDDQQVVVPDGIIGNIQIAGANVTQGYYNNPAATNEAITPDGWLDTGDLGFSDAGELYITGRKKEIIFMNGVNIYPHDIEQAAGNIKGLELGKLAIAGVYHASYDREGIVAFVAYKGKTTDFIPVAMQLRAHIHRQYQLTLDAIIPVRSIPKTTSGKVQRYKLAEQYEAGDFAVTEKEIGTLISSQLASTPYEQPETALEVALYALWKTLLGDQQFGVTQSFFEIGGNSLNATVLLSEIHAQLGVQLGFGHLYQHQSIRSLAASIAAMPVVPLSNILPAAAADHYPLLPVQNSIYYFWATHPESVAYNIPVALEITGTPDLVLLEDVIRSLIARHEILRTSFIHTDAGPRQVIKAQMNFNLEVTTIDEAAMDIELQKRVQPFDLHQGPLFRITMLQITDSRYMLFLDFHHIIFDGISYSLFFRELFQLYEGVTLPHLPVQYKDYAQKEADSHDNRKEEAAAYWHRVHSSQSPVMDFPADYPRPQVFNHRGHKISIPFDTVTAIEIKELARQQQMTPFVVFLAAYTVFLSKYSDENSFTVGVPVSLRNDPDLQQLPGMFVNNLAVRLKVDREATFETLLKEVNSHFLKSLDHREYPFDQLQQVLHRKRDISRNPLFDTTLIYHDIGEDEIFNSIGWQARRYFFDPGISKYDFSLELFYTTYGFTCYAEYARQLFKEDSIRKMADYFQQLLKSLTRNIAVEIANITVPPHADAVTGMAPVMPVWVPDTTSLVHVQFEQQVLLTPGAIAITDGEQDITFDELNSYANRLAAELVRRGLQQEQPVAIVLDRSTVFIAAILAVLKAGGCYVPVDPDLPVERVQYLVKDCGAGMLITGSRQQVLFSTGNETAVTAIVLDELADIPENVSLVTLAAVSPRQLAYIIYTSGTTGQPKGVMIEHHSLFNYISFAAGYYVKETPPCFPFFTSVSFDLTITSIFVPLFTGGRIIVFREEEDMMMDRIIADKRIDTIKLTPSHLKMLKAGIQMTGGRSRIKTVIAGGEALSRALCEDIQVLMGKEVRIWNEYGPTEATVGCMIYEYDQQEESGRAAVPIGKPIHHLQIALLDAALQPVPVGATGELYVMGAGLARGYLFNELFTSQRFITHPHHPSIRMYKTGDLAVSDMDGIIHYTGRADEQIKFNGYRIEPEEIVSVLSQHPVIREATVVLQEYEGGPALSAYYTTQHGQLAAPSALKNFLQKKLPSYMVPSKYIWLESIPLTLNGKVDKPRLPLPVMQAENTGYIAPVSEMEQRIAAVWQEVLKVNKVGMQDDFFDLGGDSIKAVQIASKLYNLDIMVSARDMLTCQTIAALMDTDKIAHALHQSYRQGTPEGEKQPVPAEQWFFDQQFQEPGWFTQSVLLHIRESVSTAILQEALNILQRHHDGLRLNYCQGRLVYNNDLLTTPVTVLEVEAAAGEQLPGICEAARRLIDIENGSLIKAVHIQQQGTALLFIAVHHLAIDGYSWRVLLEDLHTACTLLVKGQQVFLPRKTASLKDWSEHVYQEAANGRWDCQQAYWESNLLQTEVVPAPEKMRMAIMQTVMGEGETNLLLQHVQQVYKTDIQSWLITCLLQALQAWQDTDTFVIELEHHGRNLVGIDVSRTTGWFTAMFPVRLSLNTQLPAREQLLSVQEQLRQIPDDGIGYGVLKYIRKTINNNYNNAGIRFNYLGNFSQVFSNDLFSFCGLNTGTDSAPHHISDVQLEINTLIVNGTLKTSIHYHTGAYCEKELLQFKSLFDTALQHMIDDLARQLENTQFEPDDFDTIILNQNDLNILF